MARGTPGELCAQGYQVMGGYVGMPDETAAAVDAEGWLATGDMCEMDGRGYLRIVGRVKEMIIRGGENLFPAEIENVVRTHPAVLDVAVVGVPDRRLGEVAAAFVRLTAGSAVSADDLAAFVAGQLAREKRPAHWRFVDEFPLTLNGKVRKHELQRIFSSVRADGPSGS